MAAIRDKTERYLRLIEHIQTHVHSEFSLLDGLSKVDDIVTTAKKHGSRAVGITDHGSAAGAIEFYKAARKAEINPIVGIEAYISPNGISVRERSEIYHLILLAKDLIGYRNLIKMATIANTDGFYYKPRIDHDILANNSEGLICLSACASGELAEAIRADDNRKALEVASWYRNVFGDDYYLEMQSHGIDFQPKINREVVEISKKLGIKLVCTNDSHYTCPEDHTAHDILLAVQTGAKLSDPNRFHFDGNEHYFKSPQEMYELFEDVPESLSNTIEISEKCNLDIPLGRIAFPKLPFIPSDITPDDHLAKLSWQGLYRYYKTPSQEVLARLKYELDVISTTGYAPYILFVWDFVRFARERGIMCQPRGSAAGSIVLYCLNISTIDPVANKLTFERFLNPERIQMPDIDMDFADTRRDEVIEYITNLYGRDHVAQISTVGRMLARAAIRDTGRVMDYPIPEVDKVAKLIPTVPVGMTIDKSIAANQELRKLYEEEDTSRILIDRAKTVEGTARHVGVHAAGIIVSGDQLILHTPLQYGKDKKGEKNTSYVTQYEMHSIEDIGLLKMDFLGLSNLSLLELALKLIEERRGIKINLQDIPTDNAKAYEMLSRGDSTGVFQLEGAGMRRLLREFRPTNVDHISAIIALYRPGPMEHIPEYIAAKDGRSKITYIHPSLEPILNDTYGTLVYQDQVLAVLRSIAGYSMGQADIVRKAMGKKIPEEMKKEEQNFLNGAKKNGVNADVAKAIWDKIEPFAGYGFNRAHSMCYAHIGNQTAYLKANYPVEYMAAMLTIERGNTDKIILATGECRKLGINVLSPNINKSIAEFLITDNNDILFGIGAIKNIGDDAASSIVNERISNGPYKSLIDFSMRLGSRVANKRTLEHLIMTGAFDEFGRREQLLEMVDNVTKTNKKVGKIMSTGQMSMFEIDDGPLPTVSGVDADQLSAWEKEALGFFLNNHPFEHAAPYLEDVITMNISQVSEADDREKVTIAGTISGLRNIITKKGDNMAILQLDDLFGTIEIVVFPKTYEKVKQALGDDAVVIIDGFVQKKLDNSDNERVSVIASTIKKWKKPLVLDTSIDNNMVETIDMSGKNLLDIIMDTSV